MVAALRQLRHCNTLPTVIFSGADRPQIIAKSYAAGADHFVAKPTTSDRLDAIVRALYLGVMSQSKDFGALRELPEHRVCPGVIPPSFGADFHSTGTEDNDRNITA